MRLGLRGSDYSCEVMDLQIKVVKDYGEMSKVAADLVECFMRNHPAAVLGLATGSTPIGLYEELVQRHRAGLDFSRVITFNLDEYYGLANNHPASYHYYMQEHLFQHINVSPENIHIPNGANADAAEECRSYEAKIVSADGIDLQILGIGGNGHIGFNEPGSSFGGTAGLVNLAPAPIEANSRVFDKQEDVPKQALSMGIKSIMNCRKIVLLANGENKAEAIARAVEGPITEALPASVLQLHPDCTFVLDEGAAKKLTPPSR